MLLLCFLMGKLWFSHSSALAMHWQSECSFKQAVYLPSTTCVFAAIENYKVIAYKELKWNWERCPLQPWSVCFGVVVVFFHFWWFFSEILPFLVNSIITLRSWDFGSMHGEKNQTAYFCIKVFFDLLDRQIGCVLKARGVFYLAGFCAWFEKRHGC